MQNNSSLGLCYHLRELAENPLEGDYNVDHLAEMQEEPALDGLSIEYSDKMEIAMYFGLTMEQVCDLEKELQPV